MLNCKKNVCRPRNNNCTSAEVREYGDCEEPILNIARSHVATIPQDNDKSLHRLEIVNASIFTKFTSMDSDNEDILWAIYPFDNHN